jgi:hypothetical protein
MTTHVKFPIGDKWVCVEDGGGCVPEHPDHVTFAVCEAQTNGRPGARVAARFAVRRHRVLELALRLLELADRMTPETTWANSRAVLDEGQPPQVFEGGEGDRALVERLIGDAPLNFARNAWAKSERLRARMPVLRAAQGLLEHCDDDTAASLHVLIAAADLHGGLPVQLVVARADTDFPPDSGIARH